MRATKSVSQFTSTSAPSFASAPTEYYQTHAQAILNYNPAHFGFRLGALFDNYEYDTTQVFAPGTAISNADRDRNEYDLYGRATYEFSPGYAVFAQGDYIQAAYDQLLDRNGFDRNNAGYRENIGVSMQVSHLVQGEAYIGYLQQDYHSPFRDVSGVNFGGALDWFAQEDLTVHLTASHVLVATTLASASTNDDELVRLSGDYELLPNVILQAGFDYTDSRFKGITRDDQVTGADLGVNYLLNRYLSADIRYRHENRTSNAAGFNYNDNLITAGITTHL